MAKILLIDDEEPLRALLRLWLDGAGYDVLETGSAAGALKRLDQGEVDLIITDLLMPDMDGLELTREIRRRGSVVPIVVMSGSSNEGLALAMLPIAKALGATSILSKPFSHGELLAVVNAELAR